MTIPLEIAVADALAPPPRGDQELGVVRPMALVPDGRRDGGVEPLGRAEQVLGDADPESEDGRRGEREVHEGADAKLVPAVDHREEGEVRVRGRGVGFRGLADGELVEEGVFEEEWGTKGRRVVAEDKVACGVETRAELVLALLDHELEECRDALSVLVDLASSCRVEDGEAGVDVPFRGLRAECQRCRLNI